MMKIASLKTKSGNYFLPNIGKVSLFLLSLFFSTFYSQIHISGGAVIISDGNEANSSKKEIISSGQIYIVKGTITVGFHNVENREDVVAVKAVKKTPKPLKPQKEKQNDEHKEVLVKQKSSQSHISFQFSSTSDKKVKYSSEKHVFGIFSDTSNHSKFIKPFASLDIFHFRAYVVNKICITDENQISHTHHSVSSIRPPPFLYS